MKKERITLTLFPEYKWVSMLAETVRHYSSILEIPDALCTMISESLVEGCEELIRVCREKHIETPYEVMLDFNSDAILVQITFNSRIPLHPQQMENYEVPDSGNNLNEINLDSLWLHLIKKRMDRVFFKVDGNRQTLQMMKYRREEANPKQFWIMGLAPKLKAGVCLDLEQGDGDLASGAILQNQATGNLLKLDAVSTFIVQRLDGEKTFKEIYMDYIDAVGMISPQRLAMVFEKLEQAGMLASDADNEGQSFVKKIMRRIINPNLVIPGADRVVTLAYKCCSFFFNPFGVMLLLLIGLSGIIPLVQYFSSFKNVVLHLGEFYYTHPLLLVLVYLCILLIVIIHEFGHGLVCKHYGGSIGRMGLMFYLTMFVFYCDTSSAWNFKSKKQRLFVSLGGPLTTFAILGMTLWLFGLYSGIHSVQAVFWGTLSFFCLFGLILNFNPFIKMDAYYMLMDWTGINNLRTKSFQFIKEQLPCFAKDAGKPAPKPPSRQEGKVLWFYGLGGMLVTALFVILPLAYYSWQLISGGNQLNKVVFAIIVIMLTLVRLSHKAYLSIRMRRKKVYKLS